MLRRGRGGDLLEDIEGADAHREPIVRKLRNGTAEALAALRLLRGRERRVRGALARRNTTPQDRQGRSDQPGADEEDECLAQLVFDQQQILRRQEGTPRRRLPLRQLPKEP